MRLGRVGRGTLGWCLGSIFSSSCAPWCGRLSGICRDLHSFLLDVTVLTDTLVLFGLWFSLFRRFLGDRRFCFWHGCCRVRFLLGLWLPDAEFYAFLFVVGVLDEVEECRWVVCESVSDRGRESVEHLLRDCDGAHCVREVVACCEAVLGLVFVEMADCSGSRVSCDDLVYVACVCEALFHSSFLWEADGYFVEGSAVADYVSLFWRCSLQAHFLRFLFRSFLYPGMVMSR